MKILIAMSGGVDSSVAAGLLCRDGNECIGATMKLYHNEDAGIPRAHTCCSLDDVEDARSVCYKLGMPYYVFNFSDDFGEKIIDKFVRSYESGLTPNPCIDCNRYMKFDKLYERAKILAATTLRPDTTRASRRKTGYISCARRMTRQRTRATCSMT